MTEKPELEEILKVILSSKEKSNYNPQLVQQHISNLPAAETLTRSQLKNGLKNLEQYIIFFKDDAEFGLAIDYKIQEYKSQLEATKQSKWSIAKGVLIGAGLTGVSAVGLLSLYYAAGHTCAAVFGSIVGASFPDGRIMKKYELILAGISGAICATILYSIPTSNLHFGLKLMASSIAGAVLGRYTSLKIADQIK